MKTKKTKTDRNLPKLLLVNYPCEKFVVKSFAGYADTLAQHHESYTEKAPLTAKVAWAMVIMERQPELVGETYYSVATIGLEEINDPSIQWFADAVKVAMSRSKKNMK